MIFYLIQVVSFSYAVLSHMQWRWCALHRILNTKQTECIAIYINEWYVSIYYYISMNKYIYKVRFVFI